MICDSYILYRCPDPDCEYWDIYSGSCPNHHGRPFGDYPDLVRLVVRPDPVELRRAECKDAV
jgi:hypothetical protein